MCENVSKINLINIKESYFSVNMSMQQFMHRNTEVAAAAQEDKSCSKISKNFLMPTLAFLILGFSRRFFGG